MNKNSRNPVLASLVFAQAKACEVHIEHHASRQVLGGLLVFLTKFWSLCVNEVAASQSHHRVDAGYLRCCVAWVLWSTYTKTHQIGLQCTLDQTSTKAKASDGALPFFGAEQV